MCCYIKSSVTYFILLAFRLVCPYCGRDKFGNALGVTHHLRIVHKVNLVTSEERIKRCGIPITEQDALALIPKEYIRRNEKNFQDIIQPFFANDLSTRSPLGASYNALLPPHGTATPVLDSTKISTAAETSPCLIEIEPKLHKKSQVNELNESRFYLRKTLYSTDYARMLFDPTEDSATASTSAFINEDDKEDNLPIPSDNEEESYEDAHLCKKGRFSKHKNRQQVTKKKSINLPKKIPLDAQGNPVDSLKPFEWQLVISGPPEAINEISEYIEKVQFILHPSHRPLHMIEVRKPPFKICVKAYAASMVKINIFLKYSAVDAVDGKNSGTNPLAESKDGKKYDGKKLVIYHQIKALMPRFLKHDSFTKGNVNHVFVALDKHSVPKAHSSDVPLPIEQEVIHTVFLKEKELEPDDLEFIESGKRKRKIKAKNVKSDTSDAKASEIIVKGLAEPSLWRQGSPLTMQHPVVGSKVAAKLPRPEEQYSAARAAPSALSSYIKNRKNIKKLIQDLPKLERHQIISPSVNLGTPPLSAPLMSPFMPRAIVQVRSLPIRPNDVFNERPASISAEETFSYSFAPFKKEPILTQYASDKFVADMLSRYVAYYPLLASDSIDLTEGDRNFIPKRTFACVSSLEAWNKLGSPEKLSKEWQRAKCIRNLALKYAKLQQTYHEPLKKTATESSKLQDVKLHHCFDTVEILKWCRLKGHTPTEVGIMAKSNECIPRDPLVSIVEKVKTTPQTLPDSSAASGKDYKGPNSRRAPQSSAAAMSRGVSSVFSPKRQLVREMEPLNNPYLVVRHHYCRFCGRQLVVNQPSAESSNAVSTVENHVRKCFYRPLRTQLWTILDPGSLSFKHLSSQLANPSIPDDELREIRSSVEEHCKLLERSEKFARLIKDTLRLKDGPSGSWFGSEFFPVDWLPRGYRGNDAALMPKFQVDPKMLDYLIVTRLSKGENSSTPFFPHSSAARHFISFALEIYLAELISLCIYFARLPNSTSGTLLASQGTLSESVTYHGKYMKCLTPIHVFKAVNQHPHSTFLQ